MGGADGLAFAAAQAVFHAGGNRANVALLHDQRFMPHQAKAGGVGIGQVGVDGCIARIAQQFAFVKAAFGVDFGFVVGKGLQLCVA